MRIAIIGTGGVGGYVGAKLWSAGHDVTFVARGAHLAAMQQRGLRLESPEGSITVHATFTDSLIGQLPVEIVIVGVKSFDTPSAIDLIRPSLGKTTTILSIQNGVENEEQLAATFGREAVVAGVAYIFSTIAEPGVIRHHSGTTKFKVGPLVSVSEERARSLEHTFRTAGIDTEYRAEILPLLWEKWIFICGLGGMTAYARLSIGEILSDTKLATMLRSVITEATAVARAKKIGEFTNLEERLMVRYTRLPETHTSSMYYDVTHGKRLEIESLNGAAVRLGKVVNVATPSNKTIYDSLKSLG